MSMCLPSILNFRTRINFANLIKDRKYHFKTYKKCFIGKEVVSWLQGSKLCDCRETAVKAMQILQDNYIIHHGKITFFTSGTYIPQWKWVVCFITKPS